MLCMVEPCLELLRLFRPLGRRRIRNLRWTKNRSDVNAQWGRYNSVTKDFELASPSSYLSSSDEGVLSQQTMIGNAMGLSKLHSVRKVVIFLGILNWGISLVSAYVVVSAARAKCPQKVFIASSIVGVGAGIRVLWMLGMAYAQAVTASAMIAEERDPSSQPAADGRTLSRAERRRWYKRWLWWSRVGFLVTGVQVVGAGYLTFIVVTKSAKYFAYSCSIGEDDVWLQILLVSMPLAAWVVTLAQCCMGSDVMAWRSLYHDHDEAWRAHYREMFDYGIREALCCLGRRRYLSQLDKDEVDSVAALLGDLVAYRARGASHLEVVAGIALLREQKLLPPPSDDDQAAPDSLLREATILHPYAVAAYTGPLLDMGRNPLTFMCVWLHRQGILTFWNRNRRPELEGDNWWRGHAAAFLRHARVPPEALRKGRVLQTNRETVYFVVVLHHLRSVVVAVRGTETPEDLLTDGLGRECELSKSDLLGLLNGAGIPAEVKKQVEETMPHYGHVGVIQAARELSMQLDNLAEDDSDEQAVEDCPSNKSLGDAETLLLGQRKGLLTELLGPGGECEGYSLRFVGHSLGGSIAALTALRLFRRYPELHVYAYGVLPCVDAVTADACASFITSVIYNDEFSSRLSVAAIMRLRAAALRAIAADANTDTALLTKITRSLFGDTGQSTSSNIQRQHSGHSRTGSIREEASERGDNPAREHALQQRSKRYRPFYMLKGGIFLFQNAYQCVFQVSSHQKATASVNDVDLPVLSHLSDGFSSLCVEEEQDLNRRDEVANDLHDVGKGAKEIEFSGSKDLSGGVLVLNRPVVTHEHYRKEERVRTFHTGQDVYHTQENLRKCSSSHTSHQLQEDKWIENVHDDDGLKPDLGREEIVEMCVELEPVRSSVRGSIDIRMERSGRIGSKEEDLGLDQEVKNFLKREKLCQDSDRVICGVVAGREVNNSGGTAEEDGEKAMRFSSSKREGERDPPSEAEHESRHPGGLTDLDLLPNGMPKDVGDDLIGYNSGSDLQSLWPVEMFVPGLVIHLIREEDPSSDSFWKSSYTSMVAGEEKQPRHRAILKDRKSFRDIVVSPAMFLDHMPWRCQHAMNEVVKQLRTQPQTTGRLALAFELV